MPDSTYCRLTEQYLSEVRDELKSDRVEFRSVDCYLEENREICQELDDKYEIQKVSLVIGVNLVVNKGQPGETAQILKYKYTSPMTKEHLKAKAKRFALPYPVTIFEDSIESMSG